MSLDDDIRAGKYQIRAAISIQDGTTLQNLHQGTAYDLQPLEFSMALNGRPALMVGVISTSTTVNNMVAFSARQLTTGEIAQVVVERSADKITGAAPTFFNVTNASQTALAANALARYRLFVNDNAAGIIYLGLEGQAAVVGSGPALFPNGGSYEMSAANGNLSTGAVKAIATVVSCNMAIQEAT